jgi:hypothetical protein
MESDFLSHDRTPAARSPVRSAGPAAKYLADELVVRRRLLA